MSEKKISVKLAYVLTLAQSGASLFTGIPLIESRERRGCYYAGRCQTIRHARVCEFIDQNDNLTVKGEEVLRAYLKKREGKRTWVRPEKPATFRFHGGRAVRVS